MAALAPPDGWARLGIRKLTTFGQVDNVRLVCSRDNSYPWSPFPPEAGPSRTRSSQLEVAALAPPAGWARLGISKLTTFGEVDSLRLEVAALARLGRLAAQGGG